MGILRNLFDDKYQISEKLGINRQKSYTPVNNLTDSYLKSSSVPSVFTTGALRNTGSGALRQPDFASNNYSAKPNIVSPQVAGVTQYNQPLGPVNPAGLAPTGSSSGGATGAPSGAFSANASAPQNGSQGNNTDNIYKETQDKLQREADARSAQFRQQADDIFNPLVQTAGAQIGRLGGELSTLQGGVNAGAQASRDLVGKQLVGSLNQLGQQEGNVRNETGKSLRNLAEDQRNVTTSTARQLGARGAGDTSAGDYAGAAIGRQGLKQRGAALESQATGLREIEGRRFEAQNIADQENSRIEQAKQAQLQSLAQDFQGIQRQLETAKATATSDQRRYIADQQFKLRDELSKRLNDIDTEVRTRRAALSDWGTQQETLLRNSMELIRNKGAYDASNVYDQLSKAGNLAANLGYQATPQGAEYIQNTFTPGAPTGLFEPKPQKNEDDAIDQLINGALGA